MMTGVQLSQMLHGLEADANHHADIKVDNIVLDSRKVQPGDVFVALKGDASDGIDFANHAQKNGASAIIVDASTKLSPGEYSIPVMKLPNLKDNLALLADRVYQNPSAKLNLIAVTGTNGKTTCAHLIAQALNHLSLLSAVIGTAGQGLIDNLQSSSLTTPDIFELRRLLAQFVDLKVDVVAFEASSHGLQQNRLDQLKLDIAIFTNLSHDHLDYHTDVESYAKAKLKLFQFEGLGHAVMNADHPLVENFTAKTSAEKIWFYGNANEADVRLVSFKSIADGLKIKVKTAAGHFEFYSPLIGQINVENLLAVFTTLLASGFEESVICDVLPRLKSVPGRMEVFVNEQSPGPMVIVDYAHTPDALEKALHSIKPHVQGRLFCVFGCGGDRDKAKRPKMAQAAQRYADVIVVTDDNPRTESSEAIIGDILTGMIDNATVISDRPSAIHWAINQANQQDVVLVAGKGHETTQQIGTEFIQMSDRVLAQQYLEAQA